MLAIKKQNVLIITISTTLVAFSAFFLSTSANQIQSRSPFYNAGIQGCISTGENIDGSPVVIHDCNTENLTHQDWTATFAFRSNSKPGPMTIFGDRCIDVTGGQWIGTLDGTFQWSGTDKSIDLTDGKTTDGTPLQLYTCDGSNINQQWLNAPNPDNGGLQSILGGNMTNQAEPVRGQPFCIGAADNADGATVVLLGCGISNASPDFPNANGTWIAPFVPLTGTIKTFDNTKCLDVPNGQNADGVKLQIWTCGEGNANQQFTIHRNTIEWKGTGKCLYLTDGNSTIGNPIQLWDCNDYNINQE
ncbi:hypothetical protein MVEN_02296500 [Mycena venus]|uniref:Ricin B lectin domain-containing protein n=1 Tax=Mycena venus TaxID=2733690 RepID=A0A8H7CEU6_9AGAR|nr:hypothetical protein MVEN_02296500 [Mycena venus]